MYVKQGKVAFIIEIPSLHIQCRIFKKARSSSVVGVHHHQLNKRLKVNLQNEKEKGKINDDNKVHNRVEVKEADKQKIKKSSNELGA